jgi:solute carrier family 25 phosphate transporter 23/24/25/41
MERAILLPEQRARLIKSWKWITDYCPDPGYFAAGGIAGIVSRTSTAPLDRLKVYLIANTGELKSSAVGIAAKGQPVMAVKQLGRPLVMAMRDLWAAGGVRSLFAGTSTLPLRSILDSC